MFLSLHCLDNTLTVDVGSQPGTAWTLSSFKPGSGVAELRSSDMSKLWQSDGSQPHLVNIQFARRTLVTHVSIFLDVKSDDSYTPTKIAIKAGTNYHDLVLVRERTFEAPQGWKHFLLDKTDPTPEEEEEAQDEQRRQAEAGKQPDLNSNFTRVREGIHVWMIQLCVLANHLNGKDTHIRRIMVFGPNDAGHDFGSTKRAAADPLHSAHLRRRPDMSDRSDEAQTRLYQETLPAGDAETAQINSAPQNVTVGLAELLTRRNQRNENADGEHGSGRSTLNLFGNIR